MFRHMSCSLGLGRRLAVAAAAQRRSTSFWLANAISSGISPGPNHASSSTSSPATGSPSASTIQREAEHEVIVVAGRRAAPTHSTGRTSRPVSSRNSRRQRRRAAARPPRGTPPGGGPSEPLRGSILRRPIRTRPVRTSERPARRAPSSPSSSTPHAGQPRCGPCRGSSSCARDRLRPSSTGSSTSRRATPLGHEPDADVS